MMCRGKIVNASIVAVLVFLLAGILPAGQPQQPPQGQGQQPPPGQGQQPQEPPKRPAPDPKANAGAMLGSSFFDRDLKKIEKENVGLTLELPEGWVFGDVAKMNEFYLKRQATGAGQQAAREENLRRLAAAFHEKRNLLLHFLYKDNSGGNTIMTAISDRKSRNSSVKYEEKFYTLHGSGLAVIIGDEVDGGGAELKQIFGYFAPKSAKIIFELIGVMPKKTFGEFEDALKEIAAKLTFDSATPGDGLKASTRDVVVEKNASPLIKEEYMVQDKKEKKKKSKACASPLWKVKRQKEWEWMDIDSWRSGEKPDTSKIPDPRKRQSIENLWQQRVCGIYNAKLDAYAVLRAIQTGREVKLQEVYENEKNGLLGNRDIKMLTTSNKYRFAQFMGCRLGYEFDDRKTGRKLCMIYHFAARGTMLYIVEVVLPRKNYDEFLKYDKKSKFVRKTFFF